MNNRPFNGNYDEDVVLDEIEFDTASLESKRFRFFGFRVPSLLFADDVVLLTLSSVDQYMLSRSLFNKRNISFVIKLYRIPPKCKYL